MKKVLALGLTLVALGCVPTTTNVQGNFQARSPEAAQLRNVVVGQFSGRYGETFGAQVVASLASAIVDGQPYFTVASNTIVPVRNVSDAVSYGRPRRITGVYFGETTGEIATQRYQEQRTRCVKVGDDNCGRTQEYSVNCARATANFTAIPQLVDVRNSVIRYSDTLSGSASEDWCDDRIRRGTDAQLMGAAVGQVVGELRTAVAPYTRNLSVALKTRSPALRGEDAETFNGAASFAQQGRMDRACGIWETMAEHYPDNIEILYNRGVCAETNGDFARALQLYGSADSRLKTPDRLVNQALSRARQLASGREN